jgi:hypothetical protein
MSLWKRLKNLWRLSKFEVVENKSVKSTIDQFMDTVFPPEKKGAIFLPPTDLDEARQAIIERNREAGQDTPLKDLIEPND